VHLHKVRKSIPNGPDLGRDFEVLLDGELLHRVVALDWHLDGDSLGTVTLTIEASVTMTDATGEADDGN
jgi:hypothetical protein